MRHKANFLAELNRFEFRAFILLDWLLYQGYPTILPIAGGRIDSYLFQGYERCVKCNQPSPGFELGSPCLFPTVIFIALRSLKIDTEQPSPFSNIDTTNHL